MSVENYLKVMAVEILTSQKLNINFKKVTFTGVRIMSNGKEARTNVQGTRNLWPTHEVELAGGGKTIIKGDVEFDNVAIGDYFTGKVERCDTTPYQIEPGGRQITQYTGVIFEHENGLAVAARNLRQYNAAPIDPATGMKFELAVVTTAKKLEIVDEEQPS